MKVDVNARDTGGLISGQTALMKAAWKGYRDIANILIMNSASVDIVDDDGRTPLMYAAWNGHKESRQLKNKVPSYGNHQNCFNTLPPLQLKKTVKMKYMYVFGKKSSCRFQS